MTADELRQASSDARKQRWAVPGSAHDRLVRWTKILLPARSASSIAVLALAPLDKKGDVSFILDKKKVQNAHERMRVEEARYTGIDDKGQRFLIAANNAIQRSSDVPIVDINGMFAQLDQPQGPLLIAREQRPLQSRYAEGRDRRAGAGRRRRRIPARDSRCHRRPEAAPACERGPGRGLHAARPVPGGPAERRSGQPHRGARWRCSLENRARGGQMMGVRSVGIILALSVAAAATAALAPGQQQQPVSALKGHNSNAPVDVTADRIEVQDRADRAIFAGNVHVTQAELKLDTPAADRRLFQRHGGGGDVQIRRLDAAGGVVVHSPSETAKGDFGIYDLDRKLITLIGNVQLTRGARTSSVEQRLVINLDSGRAVVDGGPPGVNRAAAGSPATSRSRRRTEADQR